MLKCLRVRPIALTLLLLDDDGRTSGRNILDVLHGRRINLTAMKLLELYIPYISLAINTAYLSVVLWVKEVF